MTSRPKSTRSSASQRRSAFLREDVDAHAREVALGGLRLLLPFDHPVAVIHREDPHPGRLREGHAPDGDGHVRALPAMGGHERRVVHLVDVVAGEDEDVVRVVVLDDVEVLEDGVGGAAVPLGDPAAGDVGLEHLHAAPVPVEVPRAAQADVVVQGARVVLGQDDDIVDARVHAVAQREVDDPVLAAERHRRLGTHRREDREALAFAAGEDDRHRPFHGDVPSGSGPRSGVAGPMLARGRTGARGP